MKAISLGAVLLLLGPGPPGTAADYSVYVSPWKTPWRYEGARGPEHWASLDADYALCGSGRAQSPIDIRDALPADLPQLHFAYRTEPVGYLINNGATIRVNYHDAPGTGSFLSLGSARYQLVQFHFHHPSEETIDGRRYDLVLHLIHQDADGAELAVAVLMKAGRENPALARLFRTLPQREGQIRAPGLQVDPADFLPRHLGYYTYRGSQTAPPCHEAVTWIVMKEPMEVSARQIAAFAVLFPHDVRPLQPLNGRAVRSSR